MLFKYNAELDKSIRNQTAIPIRSNNARNATSLSSKTGMGENSQSRTVKPGPGNNYSVPLKVKSGDRLALVVDNIYGGKGFDLFAGLKPDFGVPFVSLKGYVRDRFTKKSIPAEVIVDDDSTGVLVGNSKVNQVTGQYQIQVPLNRPLNITARHPNYLFATSDTIITRDSELNFLLDTPFSGSKLILTNIHFYPNKDELLPSSIPELERLLDFLKSRPDWQVKITGHTNPNVFASARYLQQLSFNRAVAVKKYLLKNSIAEKRISCAGVGGNAPVVITKDPLEGLKNLRVEVTLVKK
jgi:outer membrane protein OmpA-like peptidoglycan-associated protein